MLDNSRCSVTERKCGDHSISHQKVSNKNMSYTEDLAIRLRGPLTRAQKEEGPTSHRPSNLTKGSYERNSVQKTNECYVN